MPVFPLNIPEKVNSPELLAFFQQFGVDKYLSAEEINQMVQALEYLFAISGGSGVEINRLLTRGDIYRLPETNKFEYHVGFSGVINNVVCANTQIFEIEIDPAATGKYRGDCVVLNADNEIVLVKGTEDDSDYIFPTIPDDVLIVGQHFVFGATVPDDVVTPNLGVYTRKQTNSVVINEKANLDNYRLIDAQRNIAINHWDLISDGQIDHILFDYANSDIWPNAMFSMTNRTTITIPLGNYVASPTVNHLRFKFPTVGNYNFKPAETLFFWFDTKNNKTLHYITSNLLDPSAVKYYSISANTVLTNAHHNATVWVTANCNITIPSGLREDFACNLKTFIGVTATYLTSGTTISSQSDGTVQAEKSMVHLATYSINTFILSGGGLT